MMSHRSSYDRMVLFSDAVFGVLVTVLVLELRSPEDASVESLLHLWPTAVSYALSYLFVATVWVSAVPRRPVRSWRRGLLRGPGRPSIVVDANEDEIGVPRFEAPIRLVEAS